jgi:hypothetical protein
VPTFWFSGSHVTEAQPGPAQVNIWLSFCGHAYRFAQPSGTTTGTQLDQPSSPQFSPTSSASRLWL